MTELFSRSEYGARLAAVRRRMAERDVDLVLLSSPENIFYLTGLHDWGYFAPHMLVVPAEAEPVLLTRAMKRVTVANQVKTARFEGHSDSETVADALARALGEFPRPDGIGLEMWSSGLSHGLARASRLRCLAGGRRQGRAGPLPRHHCGYVIGIGVPPSWREATARWDFAMTAISSYGRV